MVTRTNTLGWALVFGLLGAGLVGCGSPTPPHAVPKPPETTPTVAVPPRAGVELPKELTLDLGGGVKLELVLIPAGKFMMGSAVGEKDRVATETQHEVTLSKPFYMGKYAVTQEQYEKVMGANPSHFKGAKNPVETVSWDNAQDFCKKLSATSGKTVRLPTEAEREYACRAGSTTTYCFGDNENGLGEYAWYASNSDNKTHPVGEKKPNAWGLYDMHGNVWEWCQDWYGDYPAGAVTDPQGAAQGAGRVLRGGCWGGVPGGCRSARRGSGFPGCRSGGVGFRVVVVAPRTP